LPEKLPPSVRVKLGRQRFRVLYFVNCERGGAVHFREFQVQARREELERRIVGDILFRHYTWCCWSKYFSLEVYLNNFMVPRDRILNFDFVFKLE
jgi:hypothetical protein